MVVLIASAISAFFLPGCSSETAKQSVVVDTQTSTVTPSVLPPVKDLDPFSWFWPGGKPLASSKLDAEGFVPKLEQPRDEVADRIDAVAHFGTKCVVALSTEYGNGNGRFGAFLFAIPSADYPVDEPTDYSIDQQYDLDGISANEFLGKYFERCDYK